MHISYLIHCQLDSQSSRVSHCRVFMLSVFNRGPQPQHSCRAGLGNVLLRGGWPVPPRGFSSIPGFCSHPPPPCGSSVLKYSQTLITVSWGQSGLWLRTMLYMVDGWTEAKMPPASFRESRVKAFNPDTPAVAYAGHPAFILWGSLYRSHSVCRRQTLAQTSFLDVAMCSTGFPSKSQFYPLIGQEVCSI